MTSNQTHARIVGACFLISNITFVLGALVFIEAVLGAPDYLSLAASNRTQIILGVLLEVINGIAYLFIAVILFPILRRNYEALALAYVVFRIVEFLMQIASDLSPLALLNLSQDYVQAGAEAATSIEALGSLLLAQRYWAFEILSLAFGLSALLLYYMLYRTKLVPRFISAWGFLAAILVLISFGLDIFDLSVAEGVAMLLGLPMLLNEVFLGLWLILRGFSSAAAGFESERAGLKNAPMRSAT